MTTETFGRDVILEDGLVVTPAGKNRKVIWVQCPTCGPQPPVTACNPWSGRDATVVRVTDLLACSVCGQDSAYKEILIPREQKKRHEKCMNKCLDGKAFCACACRGRCHSEGECFCA